MIRIFQHGDHVAIAQIFTTAVHEIASEVYSEQQCLAWSDREVNHEYWKNRCELKRPFVAIADSEIAGFLELDPDGHIDCAYINPKHKRKGIMTSLVRHAIDTCFALNINRGTRVVGLRLCQRKQQRRRCKEQDFPSRRRRDYSSLSGKAISFLDCILSTG